MTRKQFASLIVLSLLTFSFNANAQLESADLDIAGLKQAFNAQKDYPRIISVLGVNCPLCLIHRELIRSQVMDVCDNENLKWLVIWFEDPGHPAVRLDAENQAMQINDNRVTQWWFDEYQSSTPKNDSVAILYGAASWTGCSYAWDMSLLYEEGTEWTGQDPPEPYYCMSRIGGCCNSTNIANFKREVDSLNVCISDTTQDTTATFINIPPDEKNFMTVNFLGSLSDNAVIHYRSDSEHGIIMITNIAGQTIRKFDLTNSEGSIVVKDLMAGMYIFSLWQNGKVEEAEKIVKK